MLSLRQRDLPPKQKRSYSYTKLEAESEIRLLFLDPGAASQPLTGQLIATDLNQAPPYKALSYTWGDRSPVASLRLGDGRLGIAANLETALRSLRSTSRVEVLWVDAVCINQGSDPERNHQVSLMRQIYGDCEECIVYLGEEQDGSQLLPAFFDCYCRAIDKMLCNREIMPGDNIIRDLHHSYMSLPDDDDPAWNAFVHLLCRPWFRRIWIIQEYALPRNVVMLCGDWKVDGTVLPTIANLNRKVFVQLLVDGNFSGRETGAGNQEIAREVLDLLCWFIDLRQQHNRTEGLFFQSNTLKQHLAIRAPSEVNLNFLTLRRKSNSCLASDPRDMYFALLGLANDVDGTGLKADYTKNIEEVAVQFGTYFVRIGQGMQVLRRAYLKDPPISPSWSGVQESIQNSSSIQDSSSILHLVEEKAWDHPNAQDPLPRDVFEKTDNPKVLAVKGILLDTVKHVGVVVDQSSMDGQSQKPPKWLARLAIARNALVLDDVSSNVADHSRSGLLDSKESPGKALLYEYDDFLRFIYGRLDTALYPTSRPKWSSSQLTPMSTDTHRHSAQFWTSSKCFENVKMCVTERGFFGLVPPSAQVGDRIFMIERDKLKAMFLVRRRQHAQEVYLWNGLVYVHDLSPKVDNTHATDLVYIG